MSSFIFYSALLSPLLAIIFFLLQDNKALLKEARGNTYVQEVRSLILAYLHFPAYSLTPPPCWGQGIKSSQKSSLGFQVIAARQKTTSFFN